MNKEEIVAIRKEMRHEITSGTYALYFYDTSDQIKFVDVGYDSISFYKQDVDRIFRMFEKLKEMLKDA